MTKIPKGYQECEGCKGSGEGWIGDGNRWRRDKCPNCQGLGYVVKVPKRRGK